MACRVFSKVDIIILTEPYYGRMPGLHEEIAYRRLRSQGRKLCLYMRRCSILQILWHIDDPLRPCFELGRKRQNFQPYLDRFFFYKRSRALFPVCSLLL